MTDRLSDHYRWAESAKRRALAGRKLALYHDAFVPLIHRVIDARLNEPDARYQVKQYASTAVNVCRSVTDVVAIAYSAGCRRYLAGASTATQEAFADLVVESRITKRAATINAYSWLLGPTFVAPAIDARGRLGLDVIAPDRSDCVRRGPEWVTDLLWQRPEDNSYVRLTEDAWVYYDSRGNPLADVPPVPHGLGYVPAAIFRTSDWGYQWWNESEHWGLHDATLDAAMRYALMGWTRKVQANKLLAIIGKIDSIPAGQSLSDPELPLYLQTTDASRVRVEMLDRSAPLGDHIAELNAIITNAVARYGIPPAEVTMITGNNEWATMAISVRREKLDIIRDRQLPWMADGEQALWSAAVDIVRRSNHRHAAKLPPGDELRDGMLKIEFPDLAPVADPIARLDLFERQRKLGLVRTTDLLMEMHPSLTQDAAETRRRENLDAWAREIEDLAARNITTDPDRGPLTIPQLQGAIGGKTRAANDAQPADETT